MEESAKEEDGLELRKQEESRFEGKRSKTKQGEEKKKKHDHPLLPGYPSSFLLKNSGYFQSLLASHVLSITHYDYPLAPVQAIGAVDQ